MVSSRFILTPCWQFYWMVTEPRSRWLVHSWWVNKIFWITFFFFLQSETIFFFMHASRTHGVLKADADPRIEMDHRMRIIVFWVDAQVNGRTRENKTCDTKTNRRSIPRALWGKEYVSMPTDRNFNGYTYCFLVFFFYIYGMTWTRISVYWF